MKKLLFILVISFLWVGISWGQKHSGLTESATLKKQVQNSTGKARQTGAARKTAGPTLIQAAPSENILKATTGGKAATAWSTPYTFTQTAGTYSAISGTTVGTTANDEEVFGPFNIGFTFNYNGTNYTQFSISTNGFIGLGGTALPIHHCP
ncbi:MAG: hypothetical protein IPH45_16645 [Bacteroidales bacterium]|nr:hypothetical protein [Bacteroidales bacterium]